MRFTRGIGCAIALVACAGSEPDAPEGWAAVLQLVDGEGAVMSVWGRDADHLWAVGGQPGDPSAEGEALLLRRQAGAWDPVALPADLADDTPMLNWIFGVDDQLFVVGEGGVVLRSPSGQGDDWLREATPTELPLWGVWGASADDLWAVGGDATPGSGDPVLLHREGGTWREVALPPLDRGCDALFKVWGAGEEVFVVGDAGVILRRVGEDWVQTPSGTTADLISLWGTGPDDIVAVGGRSNGALLRWDGQGWQGGVLPGVPGLSGVWVDAQGVAQVVGILGFAGRIDRRGQIEPEESGAGSLVLHAVFGAEDGSLRVAVGGSLDRSPPFEGLVVESEP